MGYSSYCTVLLPHSVSWVVYGLLLYGAAFEFDILTVAVSLLLNNLAEAWNPV